MTFDPNALFQQMLEAERAMGLAQDEIAELRGRLDYALRQLAELQIDNINLRARLTKAMNVIEHYESPES